MSKLDNVKTDLESLAVGRKEIHAAVSHNVSAFQINIQEEE